MPAARDKPKLEPDKYCNARTKRGYCRNQAGYGTKHLGGGRCKFHGGTSEGGSIKGMIEIARKEYAAMGIPLEIDPAQALLECVYIARGEVAFASERILELDPERVLDHPETRTARHSPGGNVTEIRRDPEAVHVWIEVRWKALDNLAKFSKMALDARIDERKVKLTELQSRLIGVAMNGLLRAAGLADHPEAPRWVREQLQLVAGEAVA